MNCVLPSRRRWLPPVIASLFIACAILVVPGAGKGIDFVESYRPLPRPEVSLTYAPDGPGILVTLTPKGNPPVESAVRVTAEAASGTPVRVVRRSPTTFQVGAPANSFVFIDVGSDAVEASASTPRILAGRSAVYSGNVDEALRRLKNRVGALPPPREGSGLEAVQQRDMREWLTHRVGSMKPGAAALSQPATGPAVAEMALAEELLRLLEEGRDSVALARGRQLPARRTFKVMEGGAVRVTGFDFVLRLPENPPAGSWPLLVIVHGATQHPSIQGGRREEIDKAARQMEFPFMTVAPIVNREIRGGGWNPGELAALVESIAASYPIDRDRVYLSGFSAGAAATVATVARRPDLFAAYAPLCGSGDPALAPALAQVPAYLYHGDADPTNLCFASVRFHQALEAAGGQPSLRVYRRMGHQVWVEVYREVDFYRRLLAHRRVPLVGTPSAAIEPGGGSNRLEFHPAAPASEMQVCWIDQSLKAGELWTEENSLRRLQQKLEALYPTVPLAGNVMLHFPAGWSDASSPVFVGIAVQGAAPIPAGFVLRPLRPIGWLAATYRGEFQAAGLAEAVRRFQVLRTNEGDAPGRSLTIELEHLGRRSGGGSRVLVRASAE